MSKRIFRDIAIVIKAGSAVGKEAHPSSFTSRKLFRNVVEIVL